MKENTSSVILVAISALFVFSAALATQPVTVDLSLVGNPGNRGDQAVSMAAYGSVGYSYGIGTYDVTLTQYTAFLNSVAQTDPYGLYDPNLATDLNIAGIQQSGSSGNYSYTVIGDGQRPVTYVSWFDAARFCNWLNNGEPETHVEDATTTEAGAYMLNGDLSTGTETKDTAAQWWIPSEDEWYKAAYYDPTIHRNGLLDGFWTYPTRSDTTPSNSWANRNMPNEANFWTSAGGYTLSGSSGYLTPVGAFSASATYYGTYDQGGDVFEWNDALIQVVIDGPPVTTGTSRGLRGGSWSGASSGLKSSYRWSGRPNYESNKIGFRVATSQVPEPDVVLLTGLGGIYLALSRRKKLASFASLVTKLGSVTHPSSELGSAASPTPKTPTSCATATSSTTRTPRTS